MMYSLGALPPGGSHVSGTVEFDTDAVRFDGAGGRSDGLVATVTTISFDGSPVLVPFAARTRTKNTPAPATIVLNVVARLLVERLARSARFGPDPASMT